MVVGGSFTKHQFQMWDNACTVLLQQYSPNWEVWVCSWLSSGNVYHCNGWHLHPISSRFHPQLDYPFSTKQGLGLQTCLTILRHRLHCCFQNKEKLVLQNIPSFLLPVTHYINGYLSVYCRSALLWQWHTKEFWAGFSFLQYWSQKCYSNQIVIFIRKCFKQTQTS